MLTCKQVADTASDYLDGPTTFLQRLSLGFHLRICKHCRRYLKQLRLTIRVASQLSTAVEPTDDEIEQIIQKLHQGLGT